MKKNFITLLFAVILLGGVMSGCSPKEDVDSHYKPAEYKHDSAIHSANGTLEQVRNSMIVLGYDTPVDTLVTTYRDGINKLNQELTELQNSQKLLSDEEDLTRSEKKNWNNSYDSTIKNIKDEIKKIEKKQEELYD